MLRQRIDVSTYQSGKFCFHAAVKVQLIDYNVPLLLFSIYRDISCFCRISKKFGLQNSHHIRF